MNREEVMPWAEMLASRLRPYCDEVTIAGSLRRGKEDVKDIELVIRPMLTEDLFGGEGAPDALDAFLQRSYKEGWITLDTQLKRNGDKYKRLRSAALDIAVDLFIADKDNFGNILAIRTGDAFFSKALVDKRAYGGLMPEGCCQDAGYLWRVGNPFDGRVLVPCPTEEAFFTALGLPVPAMGQRNAEGVAMLREMQKEGRGL